MSSPATCPNGHQWERANQDALAADVCPVCGAAAETETHRESETG